MAIAVISFTEPYTVYDHHGRVTTKQGDMVVSHGVDLETGRNIILPCEPWIPFINRNCVFHEASGEYILKD